MKIRQLAATACVTALLALGAAPGAQAATEDDARAQVGPCSAQASGVRYTNSGVNGTGKAQNCNRTGNVRARFIVHHVVAFIPWDTKTACTTLKPGASMTFRNVSATNNYVNAYTWQRC